MEFRALGPLEVVAGPRAAVVRGGHERSLLALLLLSPNVVVPIDQLIEELWPGEADRSGAASLLLHVATLRRALAEVSPTNVEVLETRTPGYVLHVPEGSYDVAQFETLAADGRHALATGDAETALAILGAALELWRGPAFADVSGPASITAEQTRLADLRLVVLEDRFEAELALGHHLEVLDELEAAVAEHPTREQLARHLLVALQRAERRVDALSAYERLGAALSERSGSAPSPALQQLAATIRTGDPAPDVATDSAAARVDTSLPLGVVTFLLGAAPGTTWDDIADRTFQNQVAEHGGTILPSEVGTTSAVFARASDALTVAVALRRLLGSRDIRMAVHTGEAIQRGDDYAGPTVARAETLRTLASPGQTLVSWSSATLVADAVPAGVHLVAIGQQELLEGARPEDVFALVVEREQSSQVAVDEPDAAPPLPPTLVALAETPFVGRADELERLLVTWGEAGSGQRRTVFLAGEPGIGKTRLAAELSSIAHARGATVLFGRCDEEAIVAYQPFVEALRGFAASCSRNRLTTLLGASGGELSRLLPELRQLIPELEPPVSGDPEGDRYRLFGAVNDLMVALAERGPVLLVMDDLQWADKPTLLLIRHLLRAADETPLLVLGTYRETDVGRTHPLAETLADLRRERGYQRLALKGFAEDDVRTLLTAWLGHRAPSSLARAVHVETEGNPFFVGEIVRHLADAGASFDAEVDDVALEELGIPEGIRDVIGRRITRLSDDSQRVLSTASVVGREFALDLLEQMVDLPAERCLEVLEEAMAAGMVREVSQGSLRFEFSHTLIRETLYHELSAVRRTRVHRRAGEAIEKLHGSAPGPHLAELAHHFLLTARPGDTGKAVEYALSAARRSTEAVAYEEASNHYERVLHLLDLDDDGPSLQRAEILMALGESQRKAGDTATAKATLRAAADMADIIGAPGLLGRAALVYAGRIEVTPTLTADPVSTELLERALAATEGQRDAIRVSLLARLSLALYWSGDEQRMRELSDQATALAKELDIPVATAAALSARRYVLWGPHNLDERRSDADTIIRLAREAGERERELEGRAWRMADLLEEGDIDAFEQEMAAHAELTEQLRQPAHFFYGLFVRAVRSMMMGDFEGGGKLAQQALELGEQIGDANAQHFYAAHYGALLLFQGGLSVLDPVLEEAIAMADVPAARASLAMFSVELGRLDEARGLYNSFAEANFDDVPRDMLWLLTMAQLSDVCAALDDADGAARLYELLMPYDGRLVTAAIAEVPVWGPIAYYLGRLAGVLGEIETAERHFVDALALADRISAPPFRARTVLAWAHLLRSQPGPDAAARAAGFLAEAAELAERHDMVAIGERARAMQAAG